jgi:hypothetical protein
MNASLPTGRAVTSGAAIFLVLTLAGQARAQQEPVGSETAPSASSAAAPEAAASPEVSAEASTSSEEVATDSASDGGASSGGGLFESSSGSDLGSGLSSLGFELGGYVRGAAFIGPVPGKRQTELKAAYGEFALQLRTPKESFGDGYADVRFRYGTQDGSNQLAIDLHEAYVNAYMGPIDLRLGQQIIVWGRSDAFSPTNNLTSADLRIRSPQEDDKRQGNLSARAFLNLNPVRIEGVWLPVYRATEFPPVELPDPVHFGEDVYPPPKLANGTLAGRVHLNIPAFEMSLSYVRGYAPLPGLAYNRAVIQTDPSGKHQDNQILISRVAYRQQVFGVDFATTLGDVMGLKAEGAFRLPNGWETHINVPKPDIQYVLGLDKTIGEFSMIAQYMGRYVLSWKNYPDKPADTDGFQSIVEPDDLDPSKNAYDEAKANKISDGVNTELAYRNQGIFQQRAQLQHLASVRLELLTLHDTLSISALGMMNFTTQEWLAFPKVVYKFTDHLTASVGGEIYSGPEGTLLDVIEPTLNAGYVELRVGF